MDNLDRVYTLQQVEQIHVAHQRRPIKATIWLKIDGTDHRFVGTGSTAGYAVIDAVEAAWDSLTEGGDE